MTQVPRLRIRSVEDIATEVIEVFVAWQRENKPVQRTAVVRAINRYWKANVSAEVKRALAAKKARGERVGGIPFGYQLAGDGRTLEPHADEQRALGLLRELRAAGYTFRAVADELNRHGFRSRTGGPWVRQSVHMLARTA